MKNIKNKSRSQWEDENHELRQSLRYLQQARLKDVRTFSAMINSLIDERDNALKELKELKEKLKSV